MKKMLPLLLLAGVFGYLAMKLSGVIQTAGAAGQ